MPPQALSSVPASWRVSRQLLPGLLPNAAPELATRGAPGAAGRAAAGPWASIGKGCRLLHCTAQGHHAMPVAGRRAAWCCRCKLAGDSKHRWQQAALRRRRWTFYQRHACAARATTICARLFLEHRPRAWIAAPLGGGGKSPYEGCTAAAQCCEHWCARLSKHDPNMIVCCPPRYSG
jgi:hypothetical protein